MTVHHGNILSLNCISYGSNVNVTRDEEHKAVVNAYNAAKEAGAAPTAIVLQDYEWNHDHLWELVALIDTASNSTLWKAVRQWGEDKGEKADAVVLYDRSVYIGTAMEKTSIGPFRDNDDLLAGMQPDILRQLSGFSGRWAGVELEVLNTISGKACDLQFMLFSYHGRKMISANNDIFPVQTAVKAAMGKDFIAQVADCGAKESAPVLIAGTFNIDSAPFVANGGLRSDAHSKAPWSSTVHTDEDLQKDALGQPVNPLDYAVAVHPAEGANTTTDLRILEIMTLEHPAETASHFQHKPLLMKIEVAPKA